jgi:tetratricopeptide (TPR) repeat protein
VTGGGSPDSDSALRALHSARAEVEALRSEPLRAAEARGYLLRAANAVDRSLRRLLRDDEGADIAVRLRALAPDEMRGEEVLAELRRNERLSISLAAAIHELFEMRRRLEGGGIPEDRDTPHAVSVVDRLEGEIADSKVPPPPPYQDPSPEIAVEEARAPKRRRTRTAAAALPLPWIGAAAALVLVALAGLWLFGARGGSANHMEEGITLFRSGAYEDAAHHFWRHAEANPQDPTPHLYLARIHRRLERPELAAEAIREAQRLAPEDPAVHRELGFLLLDTGRADVAVERFQHALELDADSSEGWVGLVRALRESGRGAEVDAVLARAPAEVRALLSRPGTTP